MKRNRVIILLGFLGIFVSSFFIKDYFLPVDILKNIPSFSINGWERPHNSLLADPVFQFEPWRFYAKERILSGSFPLWTNLNGAGAPFFANPQTAVLFPLTLLYYVFPQAQSLFLISFLKLFCFALFCYAYFRSLHCSQFISVCSSIVLTFSGFFIVWLYWPHTNVYLFFPLLLFFTEKIFSNTKKNLANYLGISFCYLLMILGGHPETLFHAGVVHVLYTTFRLAANRKRIISVFISICIGFLLGSLQLLPFLEYLFHSQALSQRSMQPYSFYLPIKTFIVNFIPFLLGAPHVSFYKPLDNTNFQEVIGGYITPMVLLLGIYGIKKFWKEGIIRFWTILAIVSWGIAYKIFPFYFINGLPIFSSGTNNRLIAFSGFGIVTISALTLTKLIERKIFSPKITRSRFLVALLLIQLLGFLTYSILLFRPINGVKPEFLRFLFIHVDLLVSSTFVFFYLLSHIQEFKLWLFRLLFFSLVLTQSFCLFWNYNSFISASYYYPQTPLTKEINTFSKGRVLDIGNLNLPENINIMYKIPHAENYDAMEVRAYKNLFDEKFPQKNQWKKVDTFDSLSLRDLGIRYVVSDYDISAIRRIIQPEHSVLLNSLNGEKELNIPFQPQSSQIVGLRLLTANYNRKNSCKITVRLTDSIEKLEKQKKEILCEKFRDYLYYYIPFSTLINEKNSHVFTITAQNTSKNNTISFWGNKLQQPYSEVFYKNINGNHYKNVWSSESIYLWEVPGVTEISFNGHYRYVKRQAEQISLETSSESNEILTVQKTNFPGWSAYVDGVKVPIKDDVFLQIPVRKGNHLISFQYKPASFYLGLFLSLSTAFSIGLYLLRNYLRSNDVRQINMYLTTSRPLYLSQYVFIFCGAFIVSCLLYGLILIVFPRHFTLSPTSTISWFSVHNYPKQQDYYYFYTAFPFISLVTISLSLWLIKKHQS